MVDIIGKRYLYFAISLLIIIPGIVAMGVHWVQFGTPFALAIDFTGGTVWELTDIKQMPSDEAVRALFSKYDVRNAVAQPETLNNKPGVLIRSSEITPEVKAKIVPELKTLFGNYT